MTLRRHIAKCVIVTTGILLSANVLFLGNAFAEFNSYLTFIGHPPEGVTLSKDSLKVAFTPDGVTLRTTSALTWDKSNGSGREISDKGELTYALELPNTGGTLEKATTVKIKDNSVVIRVDKEALPLSLTVGHDATQAAPLKKLSSDSLPDFKRVALPLGLVLGAFGLALFLMKKFGSRNKWIASFLGNERFKQGPLLELVSKTVIGPKRQVVVMRAGGEYLLIGCSGETMTLLTKIDEQSVAEENDLLDQEIEEKRTTI